MKILIRDEEDPMHMPAPSAAKTRGAINVIDLANILLQFYCYRRCRLLYSDGGFSSRIDNSDIRGCSLMAM